MCFGRAPWVRRSKGTCSNLFRGSFSPCPAVLAKVLLTRRPSKLKMARLPQGSGATILECWHSAYAAACPSSGTSFENALQGEQRRSLSKPCFARRGTRPTPIPQVSTGRCANQPRYHKDSAPNPMGIQRMRKPGTPAVGKAPYSWGACDRHPREPNPLIRFEPYEHGLHLSPLHMR